MFSLKILILNLISKCILELGRTYSIQYTDRQRFNLIYEGLETTGKGECHKFVHWSRGFQYSLGFVQKRVEKLDRIGPRNCKKRTEKLDRIGPRNCKKRTEKLDRIGPRNCLKKD